MRWGIHSIVPLWLATISTSRSIIWVSALRTNYVCHVTTSQWARHARIDWPFYVVHDTFEYLWRSVAAMACDQPVSLTCVNVNTCSARHVAPTGAAPCYYTGVTQTTQATTEILSVNIRHRSKVVATVTAVFSSRPDVISTLLWVLRKFCVITSRMRWAAYSVRNI